MWSRTECDDIWPDVFSLSFMSRWSTFLWWNFFRFIFWTYLLEEERQVYKETCHNIFYVISSWLNPVNVSHFAIKTSYWLLTEVFSKGGFLSTSLFVHLCIISSWLEFRVWLYPRMWEMQRWTHLQEMQDCLHPCRIRKEQKHHHTMHSLLSHGLQYHV